MVNAWQPSKSNVFFFGNRESLHRKLLSKKILVCHALSSLRHGFNPGPLHVRFVMDTPVPTAALLRALLLAAGRAIPSVVPTPVRLAISLIRRTSRRSV
jgi:hypothetical protein